MTRYAVILKENAPDPLPVAPVIWEFDAGGDAYVGLEWGEDDKVPTINGWTKFRDATEYQVWFDGQTKNDITDSYGDQLP